MSDAVPVSLMIARRALCPGCGAPLSLEAGAVAVTCEYCGCESGIERRLRTVETELVEGANPAEISRGAFVPAHEIEGEGHAEIGCPGCGSPIDLKVSQDVSECPHCGSRSKVERRLNARAAVPCNDAVHDAELAEFARKDPSVAKEEILEEYRRTGEFSPFALGDRYSDLALMVVLSSHTDEVILKHAPSIKPWTEITPWRECMLTRLLLKADHARGKVADMLMERVEWVARMGQSSGEKRLQNKRALVRAAARAFYRPDVSERLLFALGSHRRSATLKLMLDVGEWALVNGHVQAADNALTTAARMLDKRHMIGAPVDDAVDPEVLAEVMLYRLLYLRNELLAWALEQIPRWQLNDYRKLVRFVDDCAYERPELVGVIRDARIVRAPPARTFKEYADHLDFLDTLLTPAAREYGMYLYFWLGYANRTDDDREFLPGVLERLRAMLDEPELRKHAAWQLSRFARHLKHEDLPDVHEFMRRHGDSLPAVVWWSYRAGYPKAELPERAEHGLPYETPRPIESALLDELKKHKTRHKREYEFRAQEERRETTAANAERGLKSARHNVEQLRKVVNWRPDERALEYYRKALVELRVAGDSGDVDLSSPLMAGMKHQLQLAWVEYEATWDPRYKDYIEALEAQWETRIEYARMAAAIRDAETYAGKSWLGRMLHKKK